MKIVFDDDREDIIMKTKVAPKKEKPKKEKPKKERKPEPKIPEKREA